MIILTKDYRGGYVKVQPQNLDDLWYLSSIIETGDLVSGTTLRKVSSGGGGSDERAKNVIRKPMFLKLKAEKVEFSKTLSSLRVLGTIIEGPDDIPHGAHHSFSVEPDNRISINKEKFYNYQIEKLEDSTNTNLPSIILLVHDRETAIIALLKRQGYEILTELKGDVAKKNIEHKGGDFYGELGKALSDYTKRYEPINVIIASPAFFKEDFAKTIKDDDVKRKIVFSTVGSVTKNALNEILKRPELKEVLKQGRAAKEVAFVEELLLEISKDGKAAYGLKETKAVADSGAIEILLVTDGFILKKREANTFGSVEKLMKTVEAANGKIHIINSEHEGGEKLDGLGGIGAILRYKTNY